MKFDPTEAQLDEEFSADEGMDDFLAELDRKAKKMRSALMAEAFKELAASSLKERKLLTAAVTKEVSEKMDEAFGKLMAEVRATAATLQSEQAKGMKSVEGSAKRAEAAVKEGQRSAAESATAPVLSALTSAVQNLHAHLTSVEAKRQEDHASVKGLMDAMMKPKEAPKPANKPKWTFRVERDDYNRIKNIEASCED